MRLNLVKKLKKTNNACSIQTNTNTEINFEDARTRPDHAVSGQCPIIPCDVTSPFCLCSPCNPCCITCNLINPCSPCSPLSPCGPCCGPCSPPGCVPCEIICEAGICAALFTLFNYIIS